MSAFVGKWTLLNSENFDAYMKQCGVGLVTRKIAATIKPALTVTCEGSKWKFVSESTFKTIVFEFELDKEFVEITGDGRKFMSKVTMKGDKMIQQQKAINSGDKDSHFERYVDENGHLIMLLRKHDFFLGESDLWLHLGSDGEQMIAKILPQTFERREMKQRLVSRPHTVRTAACYTCCLGFKVINPYSSEDAKGLLKAAIRDDNPVVLITNEVLFSQVFRMSTQRATKK